MSKLLADSPSEADAKQEGDGGRRLKKKLERGGDWTTIGIRRYM
jgi:hypothetical protein